MSEKSADAVRSATTAESEKTLDVAPPTSNAVNNAESKDTLPDDAKTLEATEQEPKKEKEGSIKDYFRIFKYADHLDVSLYGLAFACAIASGAALPLMTLVFGRSTASFNSYSGDGQSTQDFTGRINHLVLYFVYLFVGRFILGYVGTVSICIAATRTTRALRKAFLESLLRQEVWHFDKDSNGSPATQVTMNGNRVNQGIAEKLFTLIQGMSLFFSAYVVALAVQWKLALITMSIVPAIVAVVGGVLSVDAPTEAQIVKIYSRAAVVAQDAISSIKTIHAFGAQQKIVTKYDEFLASAHRVGRKKSLLYGILFSAQTFLVLCGTALAFWQGTRMHRSGEIADVGTVLTVILSVTLGATSVGLTMLQLIAITNASSAAAELFSIIDKPSLLDPLSPQGTTPDFCKGEILIRNLCFAYPTRPTAQVLQGLDLSIPAGKTTALVGPSGCGKSTLVSLLERWYEPASGQILLDETDIANYNTKWLRSKFRLVQQDPVLFQGTVYENVAKGFVGEQHDLPDKAKMELVKEACRASNAHDFIEKLPGGYHTQVGERASMLSGGQRQRVAIARSIISDPKVLLLDEATSALDPRAERVVQDALNRVSKNKTTLVIAHKLATVMAADNIAVLTNGTVLEQGTHSELLARGELYAAMVRAQDLGAEGETKLHEESEEGDEGKAELDRPLTLQRTRSEHTTKALEQEVGHLTAGTANKSLAKCVWILLKEHPDLYPWFLLTALGSTIGGATYPAQAIIYSHLVRVFTLQDSEAQNQANFWALMFFVLALANLLGYFSLGWACNTIGQAMTHRVRREMLANVVEFDQDFFDRPENSSGSLTAKLSSVPTSLQELMAQNLGLMLQLFVNVASSSIVGIAYGWKLGLVLVFGGLTLLVAAGYIRIRLDQKLEASTEERFSSSAGLATEAVTSMRTISSLTLETHVLREYSETLDSILAKTIPSLTLNLLPYALSQSIEFLVLGLGFWYGSRLLASGEYTTSQFLVTFVSIVFGGQGTAQFFSYTTSITKAKVAANYVLWLRTIEPAIRDTPTNVNNKPSGEGPITFENITFRYKRRDAARVLRGIDLTIPPGSHIAIVGPSGCGKSTLVSLLERFYDPTSGAITLDATDISTFSPSAYRRTMSLVQQECPLYLGSVRENIALGLAHPPTEEEVETACRQANAWAFVSSLPEGLNTPCGANGLQFSGGQRQRLAVARALIRQPKLLLLDEATSALDSESERVVQSALDGAKGGRTTVAVAHRLSTVRGADVIFVVEDGRVVEAGGHEELVGRRGRYYAMCLAQSLDQG